VRVVLAIALSSFVATMCISSASTKTLPIREISDTSKNDTSSKTSEERAQASQLKRLAKKVSTFREATWECQDTLRLQRTRASTSTWALPQSIAYRTWVVKKWQRNATSCQKIAQERIKEAELHGTMIALLNRGLSGTPMAGTGAELEAAGSQYGIHPAFIAAIAGTESSFGVAPCSNNPINSWGLSSCTTGWHVPYFNSWSEGYQFMAKFLSSRWPGARTPYDFRGYAACGSCWGAKTSMWMKSRFGLENSVRYSGSLRS